ncbi:hypothetical protein V8F33_004224 [Rhypophila sp. PSN 637]
MDGTASSSLPTGKRILGTRMGRLTDTTHLGDSCWWWWWWWCYLLLLLTSVRGQSTTCDGIMISLTKYHQRHRASIGSFASLPKSSNLLSFSLIVRPSEVEVYNWALP